MHRTIGGAWRKALEALMELARAKHCQHHELVEVRPAARDAELRADGGLAAIATHQIVSFEDIAPGAAVLDDGDACAALVLLDRLRRPAEPGLDVGKLRHPRAQHLFGEDGGAGRDILEGDYLVG